MSMQGKLQGVKVLDLSMFLPGPHMTMTMADHGADVIRVEPPAGEPTRHIGFVHNGESVYFRNTHRGKRSLALNLKVESAREMVLQLAEQSHVFVESFRPGAFSGLDWIMKQSPRVHRISFIVRSAPTARPGRWWIGSRTTSPSRLRPASPV